MFVILWGGYFGEYLTKLSINCNGLSCMYRDNVIIIKMEGIPMNRLNTRQSKINNFRNDAKSYIEY